MLKNKIISAILKALPRVLKEVWEDENRVKYEDFVEHFEDTTILVTEMVDIAKEVIFDVYEAATGENLRGETTRAVLSPEQSKLYTAIHDKIYHIELK